MIAIENLLRATQTGPPNQPTQKSKDFTDNLRIVGDRMLGNTVTYQFSPSEKAKINQRYATVYDNLDDTLRKALEKEGYTKAVKPNRWTGICSRSYTDIQKMCDIMRKNLLFRYSFFCRTIGLLSSISAKESLKTQWSYINMMYLYSYLNSPEVTKGVDAEKLEEIQKFKEEFLKIFEWFCVEDFNTFYNAVYQKVQTKDLYLINSLCTEEVQSTDKDSNKYKDYLRSELGKEKQQGFSTYLSNTYIESKKVPYDTDLLLTDLSGFLFTPKGRISYKSKFPCLNSFCIKYIKDITSLLKMMEETESIDENLRIKLSNSALLKSYLEFLQGNRTGGYLKVSLPPEVETLLYMRILTMRGQATDLEDTDYIKIVSEGEGEILLPELLKYVEVLKQTFWGLLLTAPESTSVPNCSNLIPKKVRKPFSEIDKPIFYHSNGERIFISIKDTGVEDTIAYCTKELQNTIGSYAVYFEINEYTSYDQMIETLIKPIHS